MIGDNGLNFRLKSGDTAIFSDSPGIDFWAFIV